MAQIIQFSDYQSKPVPNPEAFGQPCVPTLYAILYTLYRQAESCSWQAICVWLANFRAAGLITTEAEFEILRRLNEAKR